METVTHEQYIQQLHNPEENHVTVRRIGQVMHTVLTFEQQKRGLCAFDDKRYLLGDNMDTLAHGHYKIRGEQSHRDIAADNGARSSERLQHSAGVVTDEDGEEHLVVTQRAAEQSSVIRQLLMNDGNGPDDDGRDAGQSAGVVVTTSVGPSTSRAPPTAIATTPKRSCSPKPLQSPAVDEGELLQARRAMSQRFNEMDYEIADTLITAALAGIDTPNTNIATLKAGLGKRGDLDSLCALDLLDHAHKSNKMAGLSDEEKLLFVAIKATKVFHTPYTINPHKSLFMLLTGRSANWWDNNHARMLRSISTQHHM
jgi:hypothetical protein